MRSHPSAAARGFTLVLMLVLLALLGLGLSYAGPRWAFQLQREQEQELVLIGQDYVRALQSYRAESPGSSKSLPTRLEDLLEDTRFVGVRRHIRRLHGDPVANGAPFVVLRGADGRIVGVRSSSARAALAQPVFAAHSRSGSRSNLYSDWEFRVEKER